MKKTTAQKHHVYYAGISEPIDVRRSILEASKQVVQNLQEFDKFCGARREKKQAIAELKSVINEIGRLLNMFKSHLPQVNLHAQEKNTNHAAKPVKEKSEKAAKQAKQQKTSKESIKLKPKELSELEKLEKELGEIENKLSGIV